MGQTDDMTESTITTLGVAFLGSIPATIVAYAALVQARQSKVQSEITNHKADAIYEQTEKIHTLTNSNLTKLTADLAAAEDKNRLLEKVVMALSNDRRSPLPAAPPASEPLQP